MISLSCGDSDIDLLRSDPDTNSLEDMCTTKSFSILHELLASPPIRNSTNNTTSTTSSTITHPLSYMTVTTAYSTINTTISTHTIRHQPTAATLSTSPTPSSPNTSYNVSLSPIRTHPPSTSTTKSKSTSSDIQSEHVPFTFHFIPSHPNYISKLKLPLRIVKLCSDIQHKPESSIIQIIGKHLSKQNKQKKIKKSKNNNTKTDNFIPRCQPIEHPPTSPPYTAAKTDTTTTTQYNPPILKTTVTQCTHPNLKITGTQYTLPTFENHSSTHTKSQHPLLYQPNTHHTSQHIQIYTMR